MSLTISILHQPHPNQNSHGDTFIYFICAQDSDFLGNCENFMSKKVRNAKKRGSTIQKRDCPTGVC